MIDFFDNRRQNAALRRELHAALDAVIDSGQLILGPRLRAFEAEFAVWNGSAHATGVANGTDALVLALRGLGAGPGDEVVTVANTAVPTVSAIRQIGARPVFCEIHPDTWLMDSADLPRRLTPQTKAVIPVHLYGNPCDLRPLLDMCRSAGVPVLEDCAQAQGAEILGKKTGSLGACGAFSFYPTKNLAALGDGGMLATDDAELAAKFQTLRFYGYDAQRVAQMDGQNSRLDELQAAFLSIKLRRLDADLAARRRIAAAYDQALPPGLIPQKTVSGGRHAYHLYVLRAADREGFRRYMQDRGIATAIHYPIPVPAHPAFADLAADLPVTEAVVRENVSLPLYPEFPDAELARVCEALQAYPGGGRHP